MSNKTKDKLNIIVTGGTGRFGSTLKKIKTNYNVFYPNKKELNILNSKSIEDYIKKKKAKILIHLAGLSRPMNIHEENIKKSINLNIIGTSKIVIGCSKFNVKLIYISTNFVYPGTKGNYNEDDDLKPINNYAWSKLGGEAAVKLYKNSLILRVCTTEEPFIHNKAFTDVRTNFEYHANIAPIIFKLIKKKGIVNIGGKAQTVYNFAKSKGVNVKKISAKKLFGKHYPTRQDMSIKKMNKFLNI